MEVISPGLVSQWRLIQVKQTCDVYSTITADHYCQP